MTCLPLMDILEGSGLGPLEVTLCISRERTPGSLGVQAAIDSAATRCPQVPVATSSISNAARASERPTPSAGPCWSPSRRLYVVPAGLLPCVSLITHAVSNMT